MADAKRDFFDPEKLDQLWIPKEGDLYTPGPDLGSLPAEPLKLWQHFVPLFESHFGSTLKKICDPMMEEIQILLEKMFPPEDTGEEENTEKVVLDEKELAEIKTTLKGLFNQLEDMTDAFLMTGQKK